MAKTCVLVVDDEPISLELLIENLEDEGYETVAAEGGERAWQLIQEAPERFDVILLDRMMPDIDGIEVLHRIRRLSTMMNTPVIMQTARSTDAEVSEGLHAGAYYYLTKPFSAVTLLAIVAAATKERRQRQELLKEAEQTAATLSCLERAAFRFRTPHEARSLASLMANATQEPGRIALGLSELLLNAIEHGNLAITYDEKSELIKDERLHEEIARRLQLPEFADRHVLLTYQRSPQGDVFTVEDQGAGFDWRNYIEMRPERAFHTHGRGIAMAKMLSFDTLDYQGAGNVVVATVVTRK